LILLRYFDVIEVDLRFDAASRLDMTAARIHRATSATSPAEARLRAAPETAVKRRSTPERLFDNFLEDGSE
jgi:hypothetical protein